MRKFFQEVFSAIELPTCILVQNIFGELLYADPMFWRFIIQNLSNCRVFLEFPGYEGPEELQEAVDYVNAVEALVGLDCIKVLTPASELEINVPEKDTIEIQLIRRGLPTPELEDIARLSTKV